MLKSLADSRCPRVLRVGLRTRALNEATIFRSSHFELFSFSSPFPQQQPTANSQHRQSLRTQYQKAFPIQQRIMGTIFSAAKPFTPKVVLVTGASAGIGKDAALALINREHIVYGAARRVDRMQDLVEAGGHAIPMDISKEQEIVAAVTQILEEQGQIDVLVNNAGFSIGGPAEEVSVADGR